jgi:putative DNA primase/helicase
MILAEAAHAKSDQHRDATIKHAIKSESRAALAAAVALAESEPGVFVMPKDLDADPWLFNVTNGTIDLKTGKLLKHRQNDLITKISPVVFDPTAKSELWDRVLAEASNGATDLIQYLQRAVGYALQGNVFERAFFLLYGPPGTSKSTFIDATSAIFGDYYVAASPETWLVQSHTGGNRDDLVRLAGARLVSSNEFRKGAKFDEATIKSITGGDEITAAAKFKNSITFRPACTLWFSANDAPTIRDDDEGAWARVRRIPFDQVIPKHLQDRTLKDRLREPSVSAAILAWAVQGCLVYQTAGLGTAKAVEASVASYRSDMDRVAGFFEDCCVFEGDGEVQNAIFRGEYERWCKEQGVKNPLSGHEMAKRLQERGCQSFRVARARGWKGVRLRGSGE